MNKKILIPVLTLLICALVLVGMNAGLSGVAAANAEAELTAVSENGKLVDFKLTARDETGVIGEGMHRRAIVNTERFLARCEAKRAK